MRLLQHKIVASLSLTVLLTVGLAPAAYGQSIDNALRDFRLKNYAEAALKFYDVFANDANPDYRDQAEIYLADSLFKLDLFMPALYYYSDIFKVGKANRYYLNALQGMLLVRQSLRDHFIVPALINSFYDPEGYGQLDPQGINEINFLIGSMSYNQGKYQDAQSFLEIVPPEAGQTYLQARYLMGMIALRRGDPEGAISMMRGILDNIDPNDPDREKHRLWSLATIGIARTQYGLGNFKQAIEYFGKIPRFDEMWFNALYEGAWAFFQVEDPGRTLGAIQTLMSPYFAKRHVPEAYLIQATTYFTNCQWDRVRRTVETFTATYQPMVAQLKDYLAGQREPFEYFKDVAAGGNGKFAEMLAREVRRTQRYLDFYHMVTHLSQEGEQVKATSVWSRSQLANDLTTIIEQQQKGVEVSIGGWTKQQLQYQLDALSGFINQSSIIEFEVADAEKRWLEAGKNIVKGKRARLPRPDIPSDQWQHWNFKSEYWIDEVGYYVHSVKSECVDGM